MGAMGFTIRYQEPRRFFNNDEVKKESGGEKGRRNRTWEGPLPKRRPKRLSQPSLYPALVSTNLMGTRDAITCIRE